MRGAGSDRDRVRLAVDAGLAALLLTAGLAETWVPFGSRQGDGSATYTSVAVAAACLPLVLRRREPLRVAAVVLVGFPLLHLLGPEYVLFYGQLLPIAVVTFTVARYGRGREPYVGAALVAVVLVFADLTIPELQAPNEIAFHWGVMALVWGAGRGLAHQERRAHQHLQRAVDAEVAAAERAMVAVVDERTRIARELHDIVAHAVSLMVVQAGAAEQVVDDDPGYVRGALATIRSTGAGALADMRRVVAMLRSDDDRPLDPQPGVSRLPELVEEVRAAHLDASLEVAGTARPLPLGLDLAAYRIVQEALTNVRCHASASSVQVRLTYGSDRLCIDVVDDGVGAVGAGDGGHGLIGMRERAAVYGGTLETRSGPGFAVHAVLPVGAT